MFDAITSGNFGGVDVWLDGEKCGGLMVATTNHGAMTELLDDIGLEDRILEAGGLARKLRVFRLPEETTTRSMTATAEVPLAPVGDNPIWVCPTTEDGFRAWNSPIYMFNSPGD